MMRPTLEARRAENRTEQHSDTTPQSQKCQDGALKKPRNAKLVIMDNVTYYYFNIGLTYFILQCLSIIIPYINVC